MYLQSLVLVLITITYTYGAPTNSQLSTPSVYEQINLLSEDPDYKCPRLRSREFLKPEPEFLKLCGDYEAVREVKDFDVIKSGQVLCMLYYESFKKLCRISNNIPKDVADGLFSNKTLGSELKPSKACHMLNVHPITSESSAVNFFVRNESLCSVICALGNDSSHDVCKWSAHMLNMANGFTVNAKKPDITEKGPTVEAKTKLEKTDTQTNTNIDEVSSAMPAVEKQEKADEKQAETSTPVNVKTPEHHAPVFPEQNAEEKLKEEEKVKVKSIEEVPTKPESQEHQLQTETNGIAAVKTATKAEETEHENDFANSDDLPETDTNNNNLESLEENGNKDDDDDGEYIVAKQPVQSVKKSNEEELASKPLKLNGAKESLDGYSNPSVPEDDSYFFSYFMMVCIVFVAAYVGYHNKQKIFALFIEGRRGKRQQRRRPNSANYHKLDCNLEEAVTSSCNKNTTNVIY